MEGDEDEIDDFLQDSQCRISQEQHTPRANAGWSPSVLHTFLCGQLYGSASFMSGSGDKSSVPCFWSRYCLCSSESALASSC